MPEATVMSPHIPRLCPRQRRMEVVSPHEGAVFMQQEID